MARPCSKAGGAASTISARCDPDIERLNRNTDAVAIYNWRDLNGNGDYNPGEVNLDPNGPDFVETLGNELDEPAPRAVPNLNEKQPKSDEFSVSIERELISNFAVKVTGIHSRYNNIRREQNNLRPYAAYNIPVTNRDPGPDGEVGTPDDGGLLTYYEYSPDLARRSVRRALAGQRREGPSAIHEY